MKVAIRSNINSTQGTSFTRHAFDSKNKNIPLSTFIKLHSEILHLWRFKIPILMKIKNLFIIFGIEI